MKKKSIDINKIPVRNQFDILSEDEDEMSVSCITSAQLEDTINITCDNVEEMQESCVKEKDKIEDRGNLEIDRNKKEVVEKMNDLVKK